VNIEEVFPIACVLLSKQNTPIEDINWGAKRIQSGFFGYVNMLSESRAKYVITIDENNTLDVDLAELQTRNGQTKVWETTPSFVAERNLRKSLASAIQKNLGNQNAIKECKEWFFRDLFMITKFSEHSTELAVERLFNSYLKNTEVKWKGFFSQIKTSPFQNYKYAETFAFRVASIGAVESQNATVVKITNDDRNVSSAVGSVVDIHGFCRSYSFKDRKLALLLSDRLDSLNNTVPPDETKKIPSDAKSNGLEELKKLKELLDQGVITKSEFDAEKKKILDKRN
jgi:hypothetical protein